MNKLFRLLMLLFLMACKSETKPGGLWLSFDDRTIDEWYELRELFRSYGATVTFFVTQPDSLAGEEIRKLRQLKAEGHEIGFHGSMHVLSETYIKEHGYRDYLGLEIDQGLAKMESLGFECSSFAYPYGAKYWFTDFLLKRRFDILRGVVPLKSNRDLVAMDDIFYDFDGDRTLFALGFDNNTGLTDQMIADGMRRAVGKGEVLMLYGHAPTRSETGGYQFQIDRLERILELAKSNGLRFYTASDL